MAATDHNPATGILVATPSRSTKTNCWSCGDMRAAHFCQQCGKVQPPVPVDYFTFFGLPYSEPMLLSVWSLSARSAAFSSDVTTLYSIGSPVTVRPSDICVIGSPTTVRTIFSFA